MRSIFLMGFLGCALLGCGKSIPEPQETVVTGEVTLDGKVLTMGVVYFENEKGDMSGSGEINPDGKYRVPSAPLGAVKAAVRTSSHARFAGGQTKDGKAITVGGREGTFLAVPKRYEEVGTSNLKFTIEKNKEIKIELTSK